MPRRRGTPLLDQMPEHLFRYDGCELSPSCLNCPLPMCKYDDPGWIQRERFRKRDGAVLRAHHHEELTVPQIADQFRVSKRTVFRILRQNGHLR